MYDDEKHDAPSDPRRAVAVIRSIAEERIEDCAKSIDELDREIERATNRRIALVAEGSVLKRVLEATLAEETATETDFHNGNRTNAGTPRWIG